MTEYEPRVISESSDSQTGSRGLTEASVNQTESIDFRVRDSTTLSPPSEGKHDPRGGVSRHPCDRS